MKSILYILICVGFLVNQTSDCLAISNVSNDSIILTGKILDGQSGEIITSGIIEVNAGKFNIAQSGDFAIKIPIGSSIQIKFRSIGYRPLLIKYSTTIADTIDLDKVPLFKESMALVNFTCKKWQLLCKVQRNRYSKGLDKYTRKEREKSNRIVIKYNYNFEGKEYPFICSKRDDLIIIELVNE